jgi:hypothetical protein
MSDLLSLEYIVAEHGYPVAVHPEYGVMVAWNGHSTFNVYVEIQTGCWKNVDVFMTGKDVATIQEAEKLAKEHLEEMEGNEDE